MSTYTARAAALTGATGTQPLLVLPATDTGRLDWPAETTAHRPFLLAAAGLAVAALFLLVCYAFVAGLTETHVAARTMLRAAGFTAAGLAGVAALLAWLVRTLGRAGGQAAAEVAGLRAEIRAYAAVVELLAGQLATRVALVEQRFAELATASPEPHGDDRYLAGYADGLAGRTLGDGNVVALNGHGRRPHNERET